MRMWMRMTLRSKQQTCQSTCKEQHFMEPFRLVGSTRLKSWSQSPSSQTLIKCSHQHGTVLLEGIGDPVSHTPSSVTYEYYTKIWLSFYTSQRERISLRWQWRFSSVSSNIPTTENYWFQESFPVYEILIHFKKKIELSGNISFSHYCIIVHVF